MLARVAQAHAMTQGRDFVNPQDIQLTAPDVLGHRIVLSGSLSGHGYVEQMLQQVAVPS